MFAIFYKDADVIAWHPDPENMGPTSLTYDLIEELPAVIFNTPAGYVARRVSAGGYELYELPKPEPTPADKIATLENEATLLALELVNTQTRLDQSEADAAATLLELVHTQARLQQSEVDHAALLLKLVDKGVI